MPDFDEPRRKNMQKKSADEILRGEGDESVPAGVVIVSGAEGNLCYLEVGQSMVGDGHPVRIATEVVVGFL